ncbi:hypothetical protein NQ317_014430 [Molorchus minor]|uniref:Uncharacterized protein n=1 Tax=Molorchus minor TaxID=1323400 RepID=A0ABQ9K8B9_9CUCU|nr:hypothetical protein NQ317_014430 [Molorchus minor]
MIIEKSQKTSTNQTTKFQQLQQRFGHVEVNNKDMPLMKDINSIGDNISTEQDCHFTPVVCRPNAKISTDTFVKRVGFKNASL